MNLSGWIGVLRTLDVQTTIVQAHGLGILARGSVHQHVAITTLYKMGEMGGVTMLLDYGYWMSYGQVMSPVYPLMVFVLPGVLTAVRVLAQRNGYEEVANVLGRGEGFGLC